MLRFLFLFLLGCSELSKKEPIHKNVGKEILEPIKQSFQNNTYIKKRKKEEIIPKNFYKKISVSITKNVDIKEILREVASLLNISLIADSNIESSIDLSVKNCTFIDFIRTICKALNLVYEIEGETIYLSKDIAFVKTYSFQFLNFLRVSKNSMNTATDIFSAHSNTSINDNGSSSSVQVSTNNDFWKELEDSLKVILGESVKFSLHKQSGLLSIWATKKQHKIVDEYLQSLKQATTTQVLIEAKIVEVVLSDSYRSGINWETLSEKGIRVQGGFASLSKESSAASVALGFKDSNFSAILEALSEFGSTRTLSSPRITVLNNQTAILKVAHNQVYFKLNYDKQYFTNTQRDSVNVSSDIQTIPIGLVMSVHPSIDPNTGKISLFLRPTISRLSDSVSDPAVSIAYFANSGASNLSSAPVSNVPIVEVREVDSVLSLDSGQVGIFAGLTEAKTFENQKKLPIAGDVPILGELVQGNASGNKITEIVILIKATILDQNQNNLVDQRLIKNFSDPRPF